MNRYRQDSLTSLWVLIGVNFVVFLATLIREDLIYNFGLRSGTFFEQPWTLLTSIFLHSGFNHIIFNMLTLYFFGSFVIALVGETAFLAVYFSGGILGSVFYLLMAPSPFTIVVGASGAIYALGGMLAVLRPKMRVFIYFIPAPLWVAVIIGLIISFLPSIAWQAHLGGLVLGLAVGYYYRRQERGRFRW